MSDKLLIVDTSTTNLYAITAVDGSVLSKANILGGSATHSSNVVGCVDEALDKANLTFAQLAALAVCVGPGSFTGIRIGVATVKAYRTALNLPTVSFNTLEAFAYYVFKRDKVKATVYMNAGRGLFYVGGIGLEPRLVDEKEKMRLVELNAVEFDEKVDLTDVIVQLVTRKYLDKQFDDNLSIVYLRKPQAQEDYEKKYGSININL